MFKPSFFPRPLLAAQTLFLLLVVFGAMACATTPSSSSAPFLLGETETLSGEDSLADMLTLSGAVNPRDGAPYRTYEVHLDRGEILRISVESAEFSPTISLFAPDGTLVGATPGDIYQGGRNSLIRRAPRSGRHLLVVSSASSRDYGSFEIRTERVPENAAISYPGEVTGYLFDGGRRHPTTGAPLNAYPLSFSGSTVVEISLNSQDFDTYLSVVNAATGEVILERSDYSSRVQLLTELPAGDYEIWTSSARPGVDGRYRLRVVEGTIQRSDAFRIGRSYQGFLSWSRTAIPSTFRTGEPIAFELEESAVLDVIMRSHELDAYLVLTDDQGNLIAEDDDSGGGHDARLTWPLQAGSYILWATSYSEHESGPFRLESALLAPPQTESITLDSRIEGALTQAATVHSSRQTFVQYYILEVEEGTEVKIDLHSNDFDAYLLLEDEAGRLLYENDDAHFGTTDAQIIYHLAPGTYRIGVTTFSAGTSGAFTLEVQQAAPSGQNV